MRLYIRLIQIALLSLALGATAPVARSALTVSQPQFEDADTFNVIIGFSDLDGLIIAPGEPPAVDAVTALTTFANPPFLLTDVSLLPSGLPENSGLTASDANFQFLNTYSLSAGDFLAFRFDVTAAGLPFQFDWHVLEPPDQPAAGNVIAIDLTLMRSIEDAEGNVSDFDRRFQLAANLIPIPEPDTATLLLAGGAVLAIWGLARRRGIARAA
jgi:hypothetical protein